MANQPTKYSKFLVGAASAALVASAVAPVASAADFSDVKGNTHEEAINALADAGVISGYPDGSFQPNKTLTRSDVVKLLGKWLESEGFEAPADAVSNPRFTDLKPTSNAELLKYAAIVKDNGVFNGSNGRLLAGDNITRENMAVVIVRAFDSVNGIDLVSYVDAQEFSKDVKDLNSAKSEAQGAINVLDFFDITNPAVANFNPKGSTTRGHFATFLHKSINTDFSKVTGVANAAVSSIKAVNATTVEVTFKEEVENVGTFTIEGLTVGNAAVKQTDAKTVVITTTAQEGGKKYEVKLNNQAIGSFEGVSAVIPTKIDVTTYSVQEKVGTTVTLSAFIGVKEPGVPVTFNVDAPVDSLNKDQVAEALTDANGVATYTYTQYAPGVDNVAVYPTGAPAVRDFAKVFWGKEKILTVDLTETKVIDNGANNTYKVTYKDPATGVPVAGKVLNVTFKENLNDIDGSTANDTDASVRKENGQYVTPHQASAATAGSNRENAFQITTNSQGEAIFTVTGKNTVATPVVFEDANKNNRYEKTELQQAAGASDFKGVQSAYAITFDREEDFVAALATPTSNNAIAYKLKVNTNLKDKDGKAIPYAGATVKVAIKQNQDNTLSNNTPAEIADKKDGVYNSNKVVSVVTNSNGEATFYLKSAIDNSKATPVAWIDLNAAGGNQGVSGNDKLEDGEPFGDAPTVTFLKSVVVAPEYGLNKPTAGPFINGDTMTWTSSLLNQSGSVSETSGIRHATFTLRNTSNTILTINPKLVDENGVDYASKTVTYNGLTQSGEFQNGTAVVLEPGTTVTIHGTAPTFNTRNVTSTTKNAVLNVDVPVKSGQLTVSSQVTTVKNARNEDTRNDNNTYDFKTEVADFLAGVVPSTALVTGTIVGYEVKDYNATSTFGRVVYKVDGLDQHQVHYYGLESDLRIGTDGLFSNSAASFSSITTSKAGYDLFENALSLNDRIQLQGTVTFLANVDKSNKDQAKGNGVVNPGLNGRTLTTGVKAAETVAAKYESAPVGSVSFSTATFSVGTQAQGATADTVQITINGTDTAGQIAANITNEFLAQNIAATAKVEAGRVVITATTTTDSIVVTGSSPSALFSNAVKAPTPAIIGVSAVYGYDFTNDIVVGQTVTVNGTDYIAGNANSGFTFDASSSTVATDLTNLAAAITYNDAAFLAGSTPNTLTLTEKVGREGTTTLASIILK